MEGKNIFAYVLILVVVIGLGVVGSQALTGKAIDTKLSSSKAAVALGDLIDLGALSSTDDSSSEDTGYVTVMQTFIKTPNQKDLSADVSLQADARHCRYYLRIRFIVTGSAELPCKRQIH